jgi:hypothetical protein
MPFYMKMESVSASETSYKYYPGSVQYLKKISNPAVCLPMNLFAR